jgi:hypothetical protein
MSYILRALKKSQQERERGSVPKLTRVPEPTPRQERRLWPWWLAGALAVNLAAVAGGLWWLGGGPEPGTVASGEAVAGIVSGPSEPPAKAAAPAPEPQVAAAPPVSALEPPAAAASDAGNSAPPTVAPAAAPPPVPQVAAVPPPSATVPPPAVVPDPTPPPETQVAVATPQAAPAPDPEPSPVRAPPVPPATKPAAPVIVETSAGEISPAPRSSLEPAPSAAKANDRQRSGAALARATVPPVTPLPDLPAPVEVKPAVVVPPQGPVPPPAPEPEPDPYADLPLLRQLPYSVQTEIPDLRITVHVYGEDARSRFVVIQHKKYQEGDRLSEDLTLDAIAPGGLVLRYQDTAFWIDSQ